MLTRLPGFIQSNGGLVIEGFTRHRRLRCIKQVCRIRFFLYLLNTLHLIRVNIWSTTNWSLHKELGLQFAMTKWVTRSPDIRCVDMMMRVSMSSPSIIGTQDLLSRSRHQIIGCGVGHDQIMVYSAVIQDLVWGVMYAWINRLAACPNTH